MASGNDTYVIDILRLEKLLRAYLHRFAPKPADLEDLLQDTYTRLLGLSPDRRSTIVSVQAFALTTARNVAVDWARRRRVIPIDFVEDLDALAGAAGVYVDELVSAHQELILLAAVVAKLPERCAEVFTLRKVYGWSQREIAEHFGISISTVEAHLVKAVRRCAEALSDGKPVDVPTIGSRRWRGGREA